MDAFGNALSDYYHKNQAGTKLILHNNYGPPEDMHVSVFFRPPDEISELEDLALGLCKRKILDIGAGVGVHSLILQDRGFDVTSLERSARACGIMRERGLATVVHGDIYDYSGGKFDTLLLMMNGIGLCGDIDGLHRLLNHLAGLLEPGGQILFDSSDIFYLYEPGNFPEGHYYGEITYQYEYKSDIDDKFRWLYIDYGRMQALSEQHGFRCEMLYDDEMDQYLARLSHRVN